MGYNLLQALPALLPTRLTALAAGQVPYAARGQEAEINKKATIRLHWTTSHGEHCVQPTALDISIKQLKGSSDT
jgi:hypothetical protein